MPQHHNIIRYRKGIAVIKDDFSTVCSWVQFKNKVNWRYDTLLGKSKNVHETVLQFTFLSLQLKIQHLSGARWLGSLISLKGETWNSKRESLAVSHNHLDPISTARKTFPIFPFAIQIKRKCKLMKTTVWLSIIWAGLRIFTVKKKLGWWDLRVKFIFRRSRLPSQMHRILEGKSEIVSDYVRRTGPVQQIPLLGLPARWLEPRADVSSARAVLRFKAGRDLLELYWRRCCCYWYEGIWKRTLVFFFLLLFEDFIVVCFQVINVQCFLMMDVIRGFKLRTMSKYSRLTISAHLHIPFIPS